MEKNSRPLIYLSIIFIALGLFEGTSFEALKHLILTEDVLIADYFVIAGVGTTYINVGVMLLVTTLVLHFLKIKFTGSVVSSVFLIIGFSFFGKNLINSAPIFIGGLIINHWHHDDIQQTIPYILAATGLSPLVSELMFQLPIPYLLSVPLGIVTGLTIGMVTPSISMYLKKTHKGLTLYGTGFSLGFISLIYVSIMILFSYQFQTVNFWSTEVVSKKVLALLFLIPLIFLSLKKDNIDDFRKLLKDHDIKNMDYLEKYSYSSNLMNFALNGLISLFYLHLINAPLNGPTLGALFVVIGYSCYGKTAYSISPILLAILYGGYLGLWDATSPAMIFAAFFGTSLAPITHRFGLLLGFVAGGLTATISTQTGAFHGGLNLYNTGFSSGIIAILFAAIHESFCEYNKEQETIHENNNE